jgi:16S rRNA (uracil1498-N3)-methyltransferase
VPPRAFVPDLEPATGQARLSADESAHITRVLRLRVGARLLVFDGRGTQYSAELTAIAKDAATVSLLEPAPAAAEPRVALTLAQAVLKGDKMDAVVRDATMMGVAALWPIVTERTVVPLSAIEQGRAIERWQRVAVASAKQCGRAVVPRIVAPSRFDPSRFDPSIAHDGASEGTSVRPSLRLQLVEPAASRDDDAPVSSLPAAPADGALVAIGPEGGWSPEEVAQAREAGWRHWTLGGRTLRAESAPIAALAVLTYAWKL